MLSFSLRWDEHWTRLTTRVVAGSQKDTASGFSLADDMAGSGCGQNAVLADKKLLDAVGSTDLGNQLDHLGVPETTITTNDEESTWKVSESATMATSDTACVCVLVLTLSSLRNGQQNAGDERFTVVRLLEDSDLLAKTRAGELLVTWLSRGRHG